MAHPAPKVTLAHPAFLDIRARLENKETLVCLDRKVLEAIGVPLDLRVMVDHRDQLAPRVLKV